MDTKTILQLNEYNRQFYSQQAQSFAQKRQYFWPSWEKFWELSAFLRNLAEDERVSVLDVGCGTSRLSLFLDQRGVTMDYTGLDLSAELLQQASEKLEHASFSFRLIQHDVVAGLLSEEAIPGKRQFDVITLFGVLHHIPSFALRRQLLRTLIERLTPNGELWLTIWNPQAGGFSVPPSHPWPTELERELGDELLGWQQSVTLRYVHWVNEIEIEQLLADLPVSIEHRWLETSRGERGNICLLLKKS